MSTSLICNDRLACPRKRLLTKRYCAETVGSSSSGESGQSAGDRGCGCMKRMQADRVLLRKSWIARATSDLMSECVSIGSLYALCAAV